MDELTLWWRFTAHAQIYGFGIPGNTQRVMIAPIPNQTLEWMLLIGRTL